MSFVVRTMWLAIGALPMSSNAADVMWITLLPQLPIACDQVAVPADDRKAVLERVAALQTALSDRGSADVALIVRPSTDDETKVIACALNPGSGAALSPDTLPAGPALIAYCANGADAEPCQTAIANTVGQSWRGVRWAVPRMWWMPEDNAEAPSPLGREAAELLALGVQPLRISPDATSMLQAVGNVHVLTLTDQQAATIIAAAAPIPTAAEEGGASDTAPSAPGVRVVRVDTLQSYLECNNSAVPDAYGVLSDAGVRVLQELDQDEQEGGWRLSIAPAREVFGYQVSEINAYVGERFNYRATEIPATAEQVRDRISSALNESWKEDVLTEGSAIREGAQAESRTYHFAQRDLTVLSKSPDRTLVICQGDAGGGLSEADLEKQEAADGQTVKD